MLATIITLIFLSFGVTLSYVENATAQLQEPWKTYTSEECKVSFQYPTNWIIKTKQGTFDTNMTFLVAPYDPVVNLTTSFSLQNCLDLDDANKMAFPLFGFNNLSDAKSYSLFVEWTIPFLNAFLGFAANLSDTYGNSTMSIPQITIVERTSVKPKFISGEDAAVLTSQIKGDISNSSSINLEARLYSVVHNGIVFPFIFANDVSRFDLPENANVRQQILDSVRFTN